MAEVDTVNTTLSSVAATADQAVKPRDGKLTLQIEGTFDATLELRRKRRGGNFTVLATYTNADVPVDVDISVASEGMIHDVNMSIYTSGTANIYLSGD